MCEYIIKTICVELGDIFADPELLKRPVTDQLNVSAVCVESNLQQWCLLSVDVTELNIHDTTKIRKQAAKVLDMDYHNLWIAYSHTHSAVWGKGQLDVEKFSNSILKTVQYLKQQPSHLIDSVSLLSVDTSKQYTVNRRAHIAGVGSFSVYQCCNCKDNGKSINAAAWIREDLKAAGADEQEVNQIEEVFLDGPVDGMLQLLLFGFEGKPVAGITRFNSHAVILSSGYYKPHFSRDYCGMLVDNLSEMWGCPVFFIQGAAGNQRPRHKENTLECCIEFSKKLSNELSPQKIKPEWKPLNSFNIKNKIIQCSLHDWFMMDPDESSKRKEMLKKQIDELKKKSDCLVNIKKLSDELKMLNGMDEIRDNLLYANDEIAGRGAIDYEVSSVRFGPIVIVGASCELCNFFSLELYEEFNSKNIVVSAYLNGCDGYVLEPEDFNRGGYEPTASVVDPKNAAQIVSTARDLVKEMYTNL